MPFEKRLPKKIYVSFDGSSNTIENVLIPTPQEELELVSYHNALCYSESISSNHKLIHFDTHTFYEPSTHELIYTVKNVTRYTKDDFVWNPDTESWFDVFTSLRIYKNDIDIFVNKYLKNQI
jgi:hypothetical protein